MSADEDLDGSPRSQGEGPRRDRAASSPDAGARRRESARVSRADDEASHRRLEGWLIRQQMKETLTLPVLGVVLLALLGGSRFTETRDIEGLAIALAVPVVAMVAATAPLRESDASVSHGARAAAAATAVLAELTVAPPLLQSSVAFPEWMLLPRGLVAASLVGLALVAVPLEALVVRRGLNTRFAAWTGLVVALALYLSAYHPGTDLLGGILAAGIFAVFVGGGAGLFLGVAGRRLVGSRV